MELDEIVKLKDKGNEYFKKNEFKNAIQQYSKAIEVLSGCDDTVRSQFGHILHTNRSISYFQLKNFQKSLEDATRAVQINDKWEKVSDKCMIYIKFPLGPLLPRKVLF